MKRKIISKGISLGCAILLCFCICYPCIKANAYVLIGYVCPNPSNITYSMDASVGPFASGIGSNTEVWATYCPKLGISSLAHSGFIRFCGDLTVSNGTYAVCHFNDSSRTITLYNDYTGASTAHRAEVIVHEVGHALGLDHCQSEKNSISVMRALGFNNKAYPLSDDIEGITALYGQ